MKTEHKTWWLELADWYEKVADRGPVLTPTCNMLMWGWGFYFTNNHGCTSWRNLQQMWKYWGERSRIELIYPCGDFYNPADEVAAKRQEFCYWMADTIRDAVEKGIYPWEDK
jgi:hypothetical protein